MLKPLTTTYAQDLAIFRGPWSRVGLVALVVFVFVFPTLANEHWMTIANQALIAIVGSVSMMILTGFAGQISLGHAAFLAVGAYTAAILGGALGWPFWLCIPAAGLIATAVGLLVGPFALRLEGLYLAIVTIGLLFLVEHLLRVSLDHAFGKDYLMVPMHLGFVDEATAPTLGAFRDDTIVGGRLYSASHKLFWLFAIIAGVTSWVGYNIKRSHTGRAMMAVRDRDLAASALGVNPRHAKLVAFGISSFFAGVAGAMYGFAHPVVTLEPFNLKMSVEYVAMVVLGGVGTLFGAVWGAIAFVVLLPVAEHLGELLPFPGSFSSEHQAVLLFFPALCAFLLFEPLGLFGLWLRVKRYFLAWPFRY
jgi:branched-chain amino acid transport system permease protein